MPSRTRHARLRGARRITSPISAATSAMSSVWLMISIIIAVAIAAATIGEASSTVFFTA